MRIYVLPISLFLITVIACHAPTPKKKAESNQPGNTTPSNQLTQPFNFNVFIENSASMDGYVNGITDFETAIYNLLGDIKISRLCDSLNLNYINNTIRNSKQDAVAPDIRDFIEKLDPATFRLRGGDRTVSDLKNILNTLLQKVDPQNAVMLVSDCVFSPGKGHPDAAQYLNNQSIGIKIDFANKLKQMGLSVLILQMESLFDGMYYDKDDSPIPLHTRRPYYIWFIGTIPQVDQLVRSGIVENLRGGYINKVFFTSNYQIIFPKDSISYKLLPNKKTGHFDLDNSNPRMGLLNAKKASSGQHKGKFGFSIAANLNTPYLAPAYFLDPVVFSVNPNYHISVVSINQTEAPTLNGYTHILNFETDRLRTETVMADVVMKQPAWVGQSNSVSDKNIQHDIAEQQKTFGIKYMIEGVGDAFSQTAHSTRLAGMAIHVREGKFSFPVLLVVPVIIILIILIILKKRK